MKRKITLAIISIIGIFALSCENNESDMTVVDLAVGISYLDSNNQDLLDPNTPNSYNTNEFKIYHLINGEKELFFKSNLDYPNGYFVYKESNMEYYEIRITGINDFDDSRENDEYETITLLKLSSNETDTIKCLIRKSNNSYTCRKVYYNSNQVWDWYDGIARNFIINK